MSQRPILILALLPALLGAAPGGAATTPSTRPSARAEQIAAWFADLADPDATIRERAEQSLLALGGEDLPLLRDAVARSRPIAPTQAAALHDMVIHVYLTALPYEASIGGFLGLQAPRDYAVPLSLDLSHNPGLTGTGVPVGERIPGFAAYSVLRPGDVLISLRRGDGQRARLHDWNRLLNAVGEARAGDSVVVQVLRQGQVLDLPLRLSARPDFPPLDQVSTEQFLRSRTDAAEQYWIRTFAPLVQEPVF
jgi:hypothetical protein